MSGLHYRLSDTTREHWSGPLHRIVATRDLPMHGVREGDMGGWLGEHARLSGNAWVSGDAEVSGDARVSGNAWVSGDAEVSGDAWVSGDAHLTDRQHILTLSPIGSESVTVTLTRDREGHTLRVGCWAGTVDGLAAEVERRSRDWRAAPEVQQQWRDEYAALEAMCRARIAGWPA